MLAVSRGQVTYGRLEVGILAGQVVRLLPKLGQPPRLRLHCRGAGEDALHLLQFAVQGVETDGGLQVVGGHAAHQGGGESASALQAVAECLGVLPSSLQGLGHVVHDFVQLADHSLGGGGAYLALFLQGIQGVACVAQSRRKLRYLPVRVLEIYVELRHLSALSA
ncbi:hypothetical protein D3C86_1231050 [compost metagenome]